MHKVVVYAIGGNALQSPVAKDTHESSEILAKVMSDVVDLLESGCIITTTIIGIKYLIV